MIWKASGSKLEFASCFCQCNASIFARSYSFVWPNAPRRPSLALSLIFSASSLIFTLSQSGLQFTVNWLICKNLESWVDRSTVLVRSSGARLWSMMRPITLMQTAMQPNATVRWCSGSQGVLGRYEALINQQTVGFQSQHCHLFLLPVSVPPRGVPFLLHLVRRRYFFNEVTVSWRTVARSSWRKQGKWLSNRNSASIVVGSGRDSLPYTLTWKVAMNASLLSKIAYNFSRRTMWMYLERWRCSSTQDLDIVYDIHQVNFHYIGESLWACAVANHIRLPSLLMYL